MSWYDYGGYGFRPYVSVAQRRANAAREMKKLEKKGYKVCPVCPEGRAIAKTFWGKAWCDNLESYSDYSNRLPRGRTYIRNGSVVDLQIEPGRITARVSGSELYKVEIDIAPVAPAAWKAIKQQCAGQIGSLVELLQGKLSNSVMQVVTGRDGGLFPKPKEIEMECSCPDWAGMCKHVAAAMYGVGCRLDAEPDLLFKLRKVDHLELISEAGAAVVPAAGKGGKKTLAAGELADVFGIELDTPAGAEPSATAPPAAEAKPTPAKRAVKGAAKGEKPGKAARVAAGRKDTKPVAKKPARKRAEAGRT